MTSETSRQGEARNRRRLMRQALYLLVAAITGAAIGALIAGNRSGDGSSGSGGFFTGGYLDMTLSPGVALLASGLVLFGFVALPLAGFRKIDEHLRQQNLIGFTGGALAAMAGFPVWALLFAGGMAGEPTALGIFLLGLAGTTVTFLFVKVRDNLSF